VRDPHQVGLDPALDAVFCAALTGICANPQFFGPTFQQSPQAAVEFATEVVSIILYPPSTADTLKGDAE